MTNLSIAEKRALEEVFICLDERKQKRIATLKKYILFYKAWKIKPLQRIALSLRK